MMEPAKEPSTSYAAAPSGHDPPGYAEPDPRPQGTSRFPNIGATGVLGGPIVILVLVAWHFFWTTWANLQYVGTGETLENYWMSVSWFFQAYMLLGVGVWAVGDSRSISALSFMIFMITSILCDWMFFGLYFGHAREALDNLGSGSPGRIKRLWHFSFGAALINHLTKYVTTIILGLAYRERGGGVSIMAQRRNYNEIPGSHGQ